MESSLRPIEPSGSIGRDIELVKDKLQGHSVLGVANTCLDPRQYLLQDHAKSYVLFYGNVNDLAPALLAGEANAVLLDAPDAIVAMRNWPGKLKIIGPVSRKQVMAVAFRPEDEHLCRAFNGYLVRIRRSGKYMELVDRYYPEIKRYFPKFFEMDSGGGS
jgi:ABC-type amino acid transport substrate-binding protein